ncbi:hypothetical protein Mal4_21400 [Maioricimonas rarisocia]|uniref:Carboxypeptidase regulatory-like domain-containing protein n=1 Tax=Maioricimonas rarisocia TaxID=2528026 RepID=A0A517Z5S9_9PLAN|nr:carboxypeptidase-like regulatory domain-containing protein [Maioricimonas rarisocia]QDU37823.1 hypothetical protein Mal4_21400 [Maioricimonas rarisocia]
MHPAHSFAKAAAFVACAGMLWPAGLMAAPPEKQSGQPAARPDIMDVALATGGVFHGQLVDGQGQQIGEAVVKLVRDEQPVAETVADTQGRFQFRNVRGGAYVVETPRGSFPVRVWSEGTAPPAARPAAVLVSSEAVMRGQIGYLDPVNTTSLLLGVTGVVLSSVTLSKVNDLEDDIRKLRSP